MIRFETLAYSSSGECTRRIEYIKKASILSISEDGEATAFLEQRGESRRVSKVTYESSSGPVAISVIGAPDDLYEKVFNSTGKARHLIHG